jgi:hypothetical protein
MEIRHRLAMATSEISGTAYGSADNQRYGHRTRMHDQHVLNPERNESWRRKNLINWMDCLGCL